MEMLRHQRLPFSCIQELNRSSGSEGGRLFHIALSYQNGVMISSPDAAVSFSGRWHYSGYQMEQLCIHMSNLMDERHYSIDYDYLTQAFSAHEIDELHRCLMNILDEGLRFPQQPIHQLSMLGSHERERVLYLFNRTDAPLYDKDLYARFARFAARHRGSDLRRQTDLVSGTGAHCDRNSGGPEFLRGQTRPGGSPAAADSGAPRRNAGHPSCRTELSASNAGAAHQPPP